MDGRKVLRRELLPATGVVHHGFHEHRAAWFSLKSRRGGESLERRVVDAVIVVLINLIQILHRTWIVVEPVYGFQHDLYTGTVFHESAATHLEEGFGGFQTQLQAFDPAYAWTFPET